MVNFDEEVKRIDKFEKMTFENANIIEVEVGTTGPQGGDWGHGSRAYARLRDAAGTAWHFRIDGKVYEPGEIEILIGGDAELQTFSDALEFVAKEIRSS